MGRDDSPKAYGKFIIQRKISEGGMGKVYLAHHETLGMPAAVKVLPPYLTLKDRTFALRFAREARLAAQLRHPNIVRVLDSGREGDYHYLVMEYLDGPTCKQKVETEGKLPWREAVGIVRQVADGLGHAAKKGIIHRDVNPANIIIDSDGIPRITDLGLAREVSGDPKKVSLTQTGTSLGTPYYMSPEQIMDAKSVDLRSDVYSLGITLYHLVSGRVPYTGTAFEVMAKHVQTALPPPKDYAPDLPDALCDVIKKMAAKKPGRRYQDYDLLLADLDRLLKDEPVSAAGFQDESVVSEAEPNAQPPDTRPMGDVAARSAQETLIIQARRGRSKAVLYAVAVAAAAALAAAIILIFL